MKKVISLLLAIAVIISLVPAVFADDLPTMTVEVDKTEVQPGDTITLTLSIDQTISNLNNWEWAIYFDKDAYVKTSGELEPGCTTSIGSTAGMVGDNVDILGKNAVRVSALSPSGDPVTLNAGKIATVTFMATENITAENARIEVKTEALPDYDTLEDNSVNLAGNIIDVTVVTTEEKGYTVSMGDNKQAAFGQTVEIPVSIGYSDDSVWVLAGLCLLLLLPLASWAVNAYVRRHLQADILIPATAAKRTAAGCRVRIRNSALLPVMRYGCRVSIRNDLTEEEQTVTLTGGIGARGESSQNILLQSRYCGRLRVRISRFTLLDYLGMLPMQAPANAEARLTILPNLFPMDADMTARPAYADDGASDRRGEDRNEVYQLREYRPGDDIRQIHWKLSSKLDELILKEASQPESRSLLVFWDKRTGTPQQMDALAEVVSSTGAALLQGGVQYTLSWTEGDDLQAQDILDENQLLQAIPELVKTRGSADCRLPEMGDYSRILYFGVKPEERMMTDERVHFVLCTEEPFPDATTFTPQNYSETMQRLEV